MARRKKSTHGGARPGAGRNTLLRNRVGLTVQFDGDTYERLTELAEKRGKSIGAVVREAVARHLSRRKDR